MLVGLAGHWTLYSNYCVDCIVSIVWRSWYLICIARGLRTSPSRTPSRLYCTVRTRQDKTRPYTSNISIVCMYQTETKHLSGLGPHESCGQRTALGSGSQRPVRDPGHGPRMDQPWTDMLGNWKCWGNGDAAMLGLAAGGRGRRKAKRQRKQAGLASANERQPPPSPVQRRQEQQCLWYEEWIRTIGRNPKEARRVVSWVGVPPAELRS